MQDACLYALRTLYNLLLFKWKFLQKILHIVALVGLGDESVQFVENTPFHLLGSLVGEGYGEDGTIEVWLVGVVLDYIVYKLVSQCVCLACACAGT